MYDSPIDDDLALELLLVAVLHEEAERLAAEHERCPLAHRKVSEGAYHVPIPPGRFASVAEGLPADQMIPRRG
jgi:hypothetical protein